ncbi:MAG TPA: NAD(+) diphosphatase [Spirochaeta sp.]|nr:NAD(+) diphosphatase [Spirochaeta sp.]
MIFNSVNKEIRKHRGDDLAFVFSGADMLVANDSVPIISEVNSLLSKNGMDAEGDGIFFGMLDDSACYLFALPSSFEAEGWEVAAGDGLGAYQFVLLRHYVGRLDPVINSAAGYASHLLHWHKHSRYCGRCGAENIWYEKECAKKCPSCGNTQFPKISPAIIIMVMKGDEILLAHNKNFPEGRYSLLAGFIEMGETIEETAKREVREEVGIEIENVEYISSQSWPFPDSLMLGLSAEYKSGDIIPDGTEIVHADWYTPDTFPSIPGHGTIARKIIDEYTKKNKS